MLRYSVAALGLAPFLFFACSSKSASAPPSEGGTSLTYSAQGCSFSYTPPDTLAYQDLALDDTGPVDPVNGVPQRVRIGLPGGTTAGQPGYADLTTTAAFTWETAESNHAAKVQMGTSASSLTQVQTGFTWSLKPTIGSDLSYFHEVHVCGLQPGTTYYYQVGGGPSGSELWSATQSFTTLPATTPSGGITVGIFGDARDSDTTWQAVHVRMKAAGVLLSLVDGDVVDIGGEESLYTDWLGKIWQPSPPAFLTLGQQYIIPINGNHENDVPTSFANWALPGDGDYAETYASFNVGSVHFVMIDDEQISAGATGPQAAAQLAWLDADLKAANADRTAHPFIVEMNHRGLFSTSLHSTDPDVLATRAALAPLFDKYKVDLVINGHDHEYERTTPLTYPGSTPTVMPAGQGTTYVICAGAGADAYKVGTTAVPYRVTNTPFGTNTNYIGNYSTLSIMPTGITLTAYGLKASGAQFSDDDVIDTVKLP